MTAPPRSPSTFDLSDLVRPETGMINRRIYVEQEIYQLELERIFARSWLFLGHESQLRSPGDFFTTYMGEDPILVTRDQNGAVNAFINSCRHKGMKLCRVDEGNASAFTCSYHGWTYRSDGSLNSLPNLDDGYFNELDRREWGLIPVTRVESYKGLIFGNFDADASSLVEYLGDMAWYLDIVLDRREGGTEVIGSVHRWPVPCNWKFASDNFISDFQHTQSITHVSAIKVQSGGNFTLRRADEGFQASVPQGHGTMSVDIDPNVPPRGAQPGSDRQLVWEYFQSIRPEMERRLGELRGSGRLSMSVAGTVFPNFSFLGGMASPTFRVWQPRGPHQMETWSWCWVDRDAPEAVKQAIRRSYQLGFGPGGMLEQDDSENWQQCTATSSGWVTRQGWLNYSMGLGHERVDEELPGQIANVISEANARRFYTRWQQMLNATSWRDL